MTYIKYPSLSGDRPFSLDQTARPIWGCEQCSWVTYKDDLGELQQHIYTKHPRKKSKPKNKVYKATEEKLRAPNAEERKQIRDAIRERKQRTLPTS